MNNAFFFQTKQIPDDTILFNEFKQQNIFYSYFQVDQNYYLFFYSHKSIDIHFLYQSIDVIQELDSKQRKIRSFRGFFLYALEIMEIGKDYEFLSTNLQPFFWKKVKNIIRQNKKDALLQFLFGKDNKSVNPGSNLIVQDTIANLQTQVNSLQQKVMSLEIHINNSKYPLIGTLDAPDDTKLIQQGDSSLKPNIGSYLQENDTKINPNLQQVEEFRNEISESVSEASKTPKIASLNIEQGDSTLKQNKAENESNFVTLSQISEQEKIEVIQRGFQLQAEGRISLKKYYESTEEYSLFQFKGYQIKYETIRRTKLYQNLKE